MSLKGTIQDGHMPRNKYTLTLVGVLGDITFLKVTGLETEIDAADMPDRTWASGGQESHTELEVEIPMHHAGDVTAMEVWFQEAQDPVSSTYKKVGTLTFTSNNNSRELSWQLVGCWCFKRSLSDAEMASEGEQMTITYGIKVDSLIPMNVIL